MKDVHHVIVRDLTMRTELVGASMGESDRALFKAAAQSGMGCPLTNFDWSGITLATGSYLKAAYIPLLQKRLSTMIISSHVGQAVSEDLEIVLESQGLAALVAQSVPRKRRSEISIIGVLDPSYLEALAAVRERPHATAGELFEQGRKNIGKTGWMNRLSRLFDMGLLCKRKDGKEYRYYFPQQEELSNG